MLCNLTPVVQMDPKKSSSNFPFALPWLLGTHNDCSKLLSIAVSMYDIVNTINNPSNNISVAQLIKLTWDLPVRNYLIFPSSSSLLSTSLFILQLLCCFADCLNLQLPCSSFCRNENGAGIHCFNPLHAAGKGGGSTPRSPQRSLSCNKLLYSTSTSYSWLQHQCALPPSMCCDLLA